MRVSAQFDFPAPPGKVSSLFASREFTVAAAGGDTQASVKTEPDGAFTVTLRRSLPSSELPERVKAFVPGRLELRQAIAWEPPMPDGARQATVAGELLGAPLMLDGQLALTKTRTGSHLAFVGEVKAQVPLFGRAIEEAAVPAVLSALRAQHDEAIRRLGAS